MKPLRQMMSWIVTLAVPVALALSAVWILLNPWYLDFEYNTPGFPEDPFGFTQDERIRYARLAQEYLTNDAGIEFLGDLRFPEGQQAPPFSCQFMDDCTRLYNERELQHMVDVKVVVRAALRLLVGAIAAIVIVVIWAGWGKWGREALHALERGGWITIPLITVIVLFVLLAFGIIFVFFHQVFFSEGTWIFYTSDTLIRLFPERFWRDTFLVVGGLTASMAVTVALAARIVRMRLTAGAGTGAT